MESNLLYTTAQQQILRRAGTPGRAPWNWRAVVISVAAASSFCIRPLHAQSVQIRIGAFAATPLVKDAVSSLAVDTTIKGTRSQGITVKQGISPIATVALRLPMRTKMELEVSGSVARSQVNGTDGLNSWDVTDLTVGNAALDFGYRYRSAIVLHGGVGFTKLFAPSDGMFSKGNAVRPMVEAGASAGFAVGARTIDLDVRAQSHGFGTTALRDNGSSDGNVTRVIVQLGTTLWQGAGK